MRKYGIRVLDKKENLSFLITEVVEASGPGQAFRQVSRKYENRWIGNNPVVLSQAFPISE